MSRTRVKILQTTARANVVKKLFESKGWTDLKVQNPTGNPHNIFLRGKPPLSNRFTRIDFDHVLNMQPGVRSTK